MLGIKDLFTENRLPRRWDLIPFIIYLPLGISLATMRIFIGLQAMLAASLLHWVAPVRSVILRVMCPILGLVVQQDNVKGRDDSVKVIVSNHVSLFDHIAIHLLTGSISVNVSELPAFFYNAFNYKDLGSCRDKETLIKNIKCHVNQNNVPIDIQPEGAITSGKKGLLKFASWPCSVSRSVQPVVIQAWRPPVVGVAPSVLCSTWQADFFWFLFVPITVLTVKYLPVVERGENETEEEVTRRVERAIAEELRVRTTSLTVADKAEHEKRLLARAAAQRAGQRAGQRAPPASQDQAIQEMAARVKEILPAVPLQVISTDLVKTRNVQATVSSLLEGLIRYTPEPSPTETRPAAAGTAAEGGKASLEAAAGPACPSSPAPPPAPLDTSAKTFPKSAQERMLSFQERKLRLIESARRRYIEKHALNVINNS